MAGPAGADEWTEEGAKGLNSSHDTRSDPRLRKFVPDRGKIPGEVAAPRFPGEKGGCLRGRDIFRLTLIGSFPSID